MNDPIPQPAPDRHPVDEMGKRFAEAGGGLYAAMRAIAVQDQQRMLAMHSKRLCQDHRAQQIAAGFRPPTDGIDCPPEEEDDMGDIKITGDQYHYSVPATGTRKSWPLAAAVIAGPLLGAAMAMGAMYLMNRDTPEPTLFEDTDTVTSVRVE